MPEQEHECCCPKGRSFEILQDKLNDIRLMHRLEYIDGLSWCGRCGEAWPCPTIAILERPSL